MSTTKTYRWGVNAQTFEAIYQKDGLNTLVSTSPSQSTWTNSVTYGDNVPDWRQNLKRGISATTSLNGTKTTARITNASQRWRRSGLGQSNSYIVLMERSGVCGLSTIPPSGNPGTISDSKANNAALRKMIQRIIQVNQSFQGGVFLGELAQTLSSIKNPARGLRQLADSWRYGARRLRDRPNFRNVRFRKKEVSEALADSWLETQYHWQPLLNDIDSGAKALAEITTGQSLSSGALRAEATVSMEAEDTSAISAVSIAAWARRERVVGDCQVIYRGAMRVNPRNSVLMAPELIGFNPASFVPTAWELIPYSFLIDYFTNIGDILAGWSTLGTTLGWSNKTVRKSFTWTHTASPINIGSGFNAASASGSAAQVIFKRTQVSRSDYTGSNFVPSFEFEIPGFGSNKWLNIAALVLARDEDRRFKFGD